MVNEKFGKWTIKQDLGSQKINGKYRHLYILKCDCGYVKEGIIADIKSGKSKQCKECYKKSRVLGFEDIIGKKIKKWTVLEKIFYKPTQRSRYKCQCECLNIRTLPLSSLKLGSSTQCRQCNKSQMTHGKSYHPLYDIWAGMKARCFNPKFIGFKDYGGRGINICDRWLNIDNFIEDMSPRPSENHTLDRINNDLGYFKDNCRWATSKQQAANTRDPIYNSHLKTRTPIHRAWISIRQNCQNTKHPLYKYFGAKGVKVCDRWNKFDNFYIDMYPRPDNAKLKRIDKNKDFEKENCFWQI